MNIATKIRSFGPIVASVFFAVAMLQLPEKTHAQNLRGVPPPIDPLEGIRNTSSGPSLGDATVDASSGAMRLQVPIDVPPGTGGLIPEIALVYNSNNPSDGPFGVGWSLDLGEIRCTARFGIPDYGSCTEYELDGELLVGPDSNGHYHTFVESFRRIRTIPDPAEATEFYWEVTDTDGGRWLYGQPDTSGQVRTGPSSLDPIARWLLTSKIDKFGNVISYQYTNDTQALPGYTGQAYPSEIEYADGARTVTFVYESRPDVLHDFKDGIERAVSKRLREIQVLSNDQVFRRYVLEYAANGDYSTDRSRLVSVQQFGTDCPLAEEDPNQPSQPEVCTPFPEQLFEYTDPSDVLGSSDRQWPDLDGSDPGWESPVDLSLSIYERGVRFGDVNGDGRVDIVRAYCEEDDYPCDDDEKGTREVWLNTGAGFGSVPDPEWSQWFASLPYEAPIVTVHYLVDEGNANLCATEHATVTRRIAFAEDRQDNLPISGSDTLHTRTFESFARWHLVDLNGDGRADLVNSIRFGTSEREWLCNGDFPDGEWGYEFLPGAESRTVYLNTGSGWVRDTALEQNLPIFEEVSYPRLHPGIPGIGGFGGAWRGTPCEASGYWSSNDPDSGLGFPYVCHAWMDFRPQWVELNGDGRLDLVVLEPDRSSQWPGAFVLDDFLTQPAPQALAGDGYVPGISAVWIQASDGAGWRRTANLPFQHATTRHNPDEPDWWKGGPQVYDNGVRFVDLNLDGLTDVLWSDPFLAGEENIPPLTHFNAPAEQQGVLLNTGVWCVDQHPNPCVSPPGTGWCSSQSGGDCADDAARFAPPVPLADLFANGYGIGARTEYIDFVDVNGDGWVDMVKADPLESGSLQERGWLHDPSAPGGSAWVEDSRFAPSLSVSRRVAMRWIDVDDSGGVDFLYANELATPSRFTLLAQSGLPDILSRYDNGRGGVVTLDYALPEARQDAALESAAHDHANLPGPGSEPDGDGMTGLTHWPAHPVVISQTVEGPALLRDDDPGPAVISPAPVAATTFYAYARPRWCPEHRTSLGFRLVEATQPDGSSKSSFFYQAHGRAGRMSKEEIWDDGGPVHYVSEVWDLPNPTSIGNPATSIEEARVGRLTSRISRNEYGASIGASTGATLQETYTYNDTYGYNFVSQIDDDRPTGLVRFVRLPKNANTNRWLIGLLDELRKEDAAGEVLERTTFDYTGEGALRSRTQYVRQRGSAEAEEPLTTWLTYGPWGNLTRILDPKLRATDFCYDGDVGGGGWCPSPPGQNTHSVLVGARDPLGGITTIVPDAVLGVPASISTTYTDEPTLRREFDPFGRLAKEFLTPEGGSELTVRSVDYDDFPGPPRRETIEYVDGTTSGDSIRTVEYGDGFGGIWRRVRETPSGYMGTAISSDPTSSTRRETYPISCADADCSTVTGLEDPATVTVRDSMGRTTSVTTPDGFAVTEYGASPVTGAPPELSVANPFDAAFEKNAKGDISVRLLDGDRVVLVRECQNAPDPTTTSPMAAGCASPDRTFYTYEAAGELSTIYDALASAGSSFSDPSHFLRYQYDTLGRVVQIDDPDGGTSTTEYDEVGNIETAKNTRDQAMGTATLYGYDDLDRLTGIFPTANGNPVAITYRSNEKQRATVTNNNLSYHLTYEYDGLGRVKRKTHVRTNTDTALLMDFEYDLLDRTTQIVYPDDQTVVNYQYQGAYLNKVCEVDTPTKTCAEASVVHVSGVTYDELGRRTQVAMAAGNRTYEYSVATHRLTKDAFSSGSGYAIGRNYGSKNDPPESDAYDELGNLLTMTGATFQNGSPIAGDPVIGASYGYDQRNRISSWTRSGETEHYRYDPLGNLVGYATGTPGAQNQWFGGANGGAHAVTSSTASGSITLSYDVDGNLSSAVGGATDRYYSFDWANRLVGVGTSPGATDTLSVVYDPDGDRVSDFRPGTGERVYLGRHATFHRADVQSSTFGAAEVHIFAFGETIAYKRLAHPVLRTAVSSPVAWLGRRVPPPLVPFAAGLLILGAGGALLLPAFRLRLYVPIARHPALATGAWTLSILMAVPPLPAGGGGGGGGVMWRWLVTDHLGSGVVWIDEAGERVRHTEYAPFGKIDAEWAYGSTVAPRIYAGHRREEVTGLDYMRARWCNSETGTFVSLDPVVGVKYDPQSVNAYAYGRNNPMTFTDPSGTRITGTYHYGWASFTVEFSSVSKAYKAAKEFASKHGAASVSINGISLGGSRPGAKTGGPSQAATNSKASSQVEDPVQAAARAAMTPLIEKGAATDTEFAGFLLKNGDKVTAGDIVAGEPGSGSVRLGDPPANAVGQFGTQGALDPTSERPSVSDHASAQGKAVSAFENHGTQVWRSFVGTPGNRFWVINVERRLGLSSSERLIGPLDPSKPILPVPGQ